MADPRGGALGVRPPPPPSVAQTEARSAEKNIFWRLPPPSSLPPLSQGLDAALCTVHAMLNSHYLSDWDGGSIAEQVRGLYL